MKIKQIKIKNIASLKGEHTINFEEISDHSKTIAITGETGAGKSSILNSISIALFGKSHKDQFAQPDLVTLGEEEAEVRLTFEFSNNEYMATWKCRVRKKNKELLKKPDYKNSLIHIRKDKEVELNIKAEELIGLSFEQFTKTIILNQGEFSDFLLSSFSVRKKILESLLSNFDLTDLSVKSKRNLDKVDADLKIVESKIDGLKGQQTLSKEEIQKELEHTNSRLTKVTNLKKEYSDYNENLLELIKNIDLYNQTQVNLKTSKDKIAALTSEYNSSLKAYEKVEKEFQTFEVSSKKELLALNKTKSTKVELFKTKEQITQTSNLLDSTLEQKSQKEETNQKYQLEIDKIEKSLLSLKDVKKIPDDEIKLLEEKINLIIENKHKSEIIKNKLESLRSNLTSTKKQHFNLSEDINSLKRELSKLQDLKDIEQLKIDLNLLNKEKDNELSLLEKAKLNAKEKKETTKNLNSIQKKKSKIESELSSAKLRFDIVTDALMANELQQKIYELTRESIKNGKCIVCNGEDLTNLNISTDTKEVDYNQELKLSKEALKLVENDFLQIQTKEEILQKKSNELDVDLVDFTQLEQSFLEKKASIDQLQKEIEKVTKANTKKSEIQKNLNHTIKKLNELEEQIESVQDEKNNLNNQLEDNTKTTKNLIDYVCKVLNINMGASSEDIQNKLELVKEKINLEARKENGESALQEIAKEISSIDAQHKSLHIQLTEYKNSEKKLTALIPSEYMSIDLDEAFSTIETELLGKQKFLHKLKQDLNNNKISLAQEQSRYTMLTEQMSAYESQFITKKSQFEESKDLVLSKLKIKLESINSIIGIKLDLLQESVQYVKELKDKYDKSFIELKEKSSKESLLLEQAIRTEALIKDSKAEINRLFDKKATAEQLYKLLGKDEFRNYVLSIVEKNLIRSTNHQLNQLCQGRYILEQRLNPTNSSSDYYIIDKLNFSMQRKVSTLSGGETFMVSLAMALALSDITRGENVIDSFFIDEGFGTLDHESIEEVLEMLNTIKSQGKTITLISHIKEITSRIPVNIQVQKLESGNSNIRTVYQ